MKESIYNIKQYELENLYNKSEEIYANLSLIKMFCKKFYNMDDFYKVIPILEYTIKTSDKLYSALIELRTSE